MNSSNKKLERFFIYDIQNVEFRTHPIYIKFFYFNGNLILFNQEK